MTILSQHYEMGNGNVRLYWWLLGSSSIFLVLWLNPFNWFILFYLRFLVFHFYPYLFIGGCFVPFGAMIFYEDPSLMSLLSILSQSISIINVRDVFLLPKLASSLYSFLKDLFTLNPLIVSSLNVNVFNLYMNIIVEGLSSEGTIDYGFTCRWGDC